MNVRDATAADRDPIEAVARDSFTESYGFVDEGARDALVTELYDEDRFDDRLANRSDVLLVTEDEGEIVGFADGALLAERPLAAEIYWLHVAPDRRGERISSHLVGQLQDRFRDHGATLVRGLVLADNEAGADFYAAHGFERVDVRTVDVGGDDHEELVFEKPLGEEAAEGIVEAIAGPDGEDLFVTYSESERGLEAPFFAVYTDGDLTRRYGFVCGNCDSLAVSVDSMDRIQCENCGNSRKAARWDAAYL